MPYPIIEHDATVAFAGESSGKFRSVWDMLKFQADHFVLALTMINSLHFSLVISRTAKALNDVDHMITLKKNVFILQILLEQLGAVAAGASVKKLMKELHEPRPADEDWQRYVKSLIVDIPSRMQDELSAMLFYKVSRRDLFEVPPGIPGLWGQDVADKFPSAAPEIEEAAKCLALTRPTACVMHLMRILELGLHSLADVFKVPFANANWGTIIDQIEKQIKGISANTHGASWKIEQQFYSEASAHFRVLKDAWRNHSMHIHERYSEERAETIYQSVRGFIQHLATKLSEPA